nr:calcium-binding protein [Microvirga terricola]
MLEQKGYVRQRAIDEARFLIKNVILFHEIEWNIPVAQYDPLSNTYVIEATDLDPFIVPENVGDAHVIGDGRDNVIPGNDANNWIEGGDGNDSINGGFGDNTLDGGSGNDTLHAGSGHDLLKGGDGDDTYYLYFDEEIVELDSEGIDTVVANTNYTLPDHVEILRAKSGETGFKLTGNSLNNLIVGNDGMNTLDGKAGADTLEGGAGTDFYYVDDIRDVVIEEVGGGTSDTVYTSVSYTLSANIEVLRAIDGASSLSLNGNALQNLIYATSGSNTLDGGAGPDLMVSGAGNDVYYVDDSHDAITDYGGVDTVITSASYVSEDEIEILKASGSASISIVGNAFANTISGNAGSNKLSGNGGNDSMSGAGGNDKLWGGTGNDTLAGGLGRDVFVFDTKLSKKTNLDKVTDFNVKDDTIWLDNKIFTKLGKGTEAKPGKLNAAFFALDKAKDANDYLIYNTKTEALSYDADGSGKKAAIEIAVFKKGLKLTAADFLII